MVITLTNSILIAKISSKGAELISLQSKQTNEEYIWNANPLFWNKHSPVLFPIVGTLKDNFYIFNQQKFELFRHGFARDHDFNLIKQKENQLVFSLKASSESKKNYPFEFELQISYTLIFNKLCIEYKIINHDLQTIPFSLGAHPAFLLSNDFESYSLEFENQETLTCFSLLNGLVTDNFITIQLFEKKLPLTYSTFENDALLIKKLLSKTITLLENNIPKIKIDFADFNNLGIWTKPNAPFICIEPWMGYSDTINSNNNILEKEGIQFVDIHESKNLQLNIEVLI